MTTKILALVDALGNLVRFALMPGQRGEITGARKLIEGLPLGALLADKAYDADHFRDSLKSNGVEAVIPARTTSFRMTAVIATLAGFPAATSF